MNNCSTCGKNLDSEASTCEDCQREAREEENLRIITAPLFQEEQDEPPLKIKQIDLQLKPSIRYALIVACALLTGFFVTSFFQSLFLKFNNPPNKPNAHAVSSDAENHKKSTAPSKTKKASAGLLYINEDGVFIRLKPGSKSPVIMTAPLNMVLHKISSESLLQGDIAWIEVEIPYNNEKGWVAQQYVSLHKLPLPKWVKPVGKTIISDQTNIYRYPTNRAPLLTTANIGESFVFSGRKITGANDKTIWLNLQNEKDEQGWVDQRFVSKHAVEIGEYALDKSIPIEEMQKEDTDSKLQLALGMVQMPENSDAKAIVGIWYHHELDCTYSIEKVGSHYFKSSRCSDGSGGNHAWRLKRIKSNVFTYDPPRSTGDYLVITGNENLELRDRQGYIRTLPKHDQLWP